ncbi:kinase-like protein [Trametes elegans]|nr:kinase-like protein [Trametes elegans]
MDAEASNLVASRSAPIQYDPASLYPSHIVNPTKEEIDKIVPHLVWPDRTLRALGQEVFGQGTLYDLGDGRIVKTGPAVSAEEAKAMIFVRTYTSIPVPEVYMVFEYEGATHIVMERVDGVALREAHEHDADGNWSPDDALVSQDGLRSIMHHLRQVIEELRDLGHRFLRAQPTTFGSWPDGPFRNPFFAIDKPAAPFSSERGFHEYFLRRLEEHRDTSTYHAVEQLWREGAESIPVLTHGDLAPRNILVKDNRIVAIVDWETLGWYPAFWERMGVGNEPLHGNLAPVIDEVFGEDPEVCWTYRSVHACLTFPF